MKGYRRRETLQTRAKRLYDLGVISSDDLMAVVPIEEDVE